MMATGLGHGLTLAIMLGIITIPASYVANRFIHHSGVMRVVMVVGAAITSALFFVGMIVAKLFGLRHVQYLGFVPLITTKGWGWFDIALEPLRMLDSDPAHVRANYAHLLAEKGAEVAPLDLYAQGRELATLPTLEVWEPAWEQAAQAQFPAPSAPPA